MPVSRTRASSEDGEGRGSAGRWWECYTHQPRLAARTAIIGTTFFPGLSAWEKYVVTNCIQETPQKETGEEGQTDGTENGNQSGQRGRGSWARCEDCNKGEAYVEGDCGGNVEHVDHDVEGE